VERYIKRSKNYMSLILLCFLLFSFPFNLFFRKGEAVYAYNMNNLGRTVAEKYVQSPDIKDNLINHF